MRKMVQFGSVRYLGGHPGHPNPIRQGVLVFDDNGVHMRVFADKFVIPWNGVEALIVEGPELASKRVTVTRLATIGIFAFAAKKNTTETYLQVDMRSGDAASFVVPKVSAGDLRAKVAPWSNRLLGQRRATVAAVPPPPPPASVADELMKLAHLRDQGVLTPDQYEQQKARLLG